MIAKRLAAMAAAMVLVGTFSFAQEQAADSKPKQEDGPQVPPELTEVSGQLIAPEGQPQGGGVAYFIFQHRLLEIPHENPLERVKAIAETGVAVDKDGSFTLQMSPGNFALIYDPKATASGDVQQPGPESMAAMKRTSREQAQKRIEAIKENAQKGLVIKDGKIGDAYVVENRIVRPPVVDFGPMNLGEKHIVTVEAVKEDGAALDFPAMLKIRGKNGDIFEAHSPTVSTPGVYEFHDVFPQPYEVIAIATKPKPGEGEEATTPTLSSAQFIFEGEPMTHKVTVTPWKPGQQPDDAPPPTPPAGTKED